MDPMDPVGMNIIDIHSSHFNTFHHITGFKYISIHFNTSGIYDSDSKGV